MDNSMKAEVVESTDVMATYNRPLWSVVDKHGAVRCVTGPVGDEQSERDAKLIAVFLQNFYDYDDYPVDPGNYETTYMPESRFTIHW